jgi:hypothetical protein
MKMVQEKTNLSTLKNHLKNCSKEELISDITELFKRFESVKDFYQLKLSPHEDIQVIAKYKKIIEDEFFPKRGFGKARLSVARKAISDYRKVSKSPVNVADIMLFYVEQGVKFTNDYGDIDEPFYNSMESMYDKVTEWISKYKMQEIFEERCQRIVKDTAGIGWGFHDGLNEIYSSAFGKA